MPSYLINQATGTITADGDHLVVPRTDPNPSGRFNVRASGVFGGASIELGFMDTETNSVFSAYTDGGPFTAEFALDAAAGKFSNMGISLSGSSGTTNITLDISPIN